LNDAYGGRLTPPEREVTIRRARGTRGGYLGVAPPVGKVVLVRWLDPVPKAAAKRTWKPFGTNIRKKVSLP
jgi:hypothetical protein